MLLRWLANLFSPPPRAARQAPALPRRLRVRARYDGAQTTDDNSRHWANADDLSARAANDAEARRKLRSRARYESANNSYCRGMVLTLANDLIGKGPRLQFNALVRPIDRRVEARFSEWARAVNLAGKLRLMKQAKTVSGEAFALFQTNDRLPTPVKLDLRLIEADQVADPWVWPAPETPDVSDGIRFDAAGNPVAYYVLDAHPGDNFFAFDPTGGRWVDARNVIHWFRADRPGQVRGIPEITPALALFAQLRRYTLAVIAAAETAADFAAVLQSDAGPEGAEPSDPFETLEIEQRMMTVLPSGWKLGQVQTEQPATTYDMFKAEILGEISRCTNLPYILASGDYRGANYSSGRLAHQGYFKSVMVERSDLESAVLSPVFSAWLAEALLIPDYLPLGLSAVDLSHRWFWDGIGEVDPSKEATANKTLLGSRQTTLAELYAARGQDWEEALEQRAIEIQRVIELGLPPTQEEDPGQAWAEDVTPESDVFEEENGESEVEESEAAASRNGRFGPN